MTTSDSAEQRKRYRIQGSVQIFIDYVEEDADSKEIALKEAKEWARDEYCLPSYSYDDYDISVTATEIEDGEG